MNAASILSSYSSSLLFGMFIVSSVYTLLRVFYVYCVLPNIRYVLVHLVYAQCSCSLFVILRSSRDLVADRCSLSLSLPKNTHTQTRTSYSLMFSIIIKIGSAFVHSHRKTSPHPIATEHSYTFTFTHSPILAYVHEIHFVPFVSIVLPLFGCSCLHGMALWSSPYWNIHVAVLCLVVFSFNLTVAVTAHTFSELLRFSVRHREKLCACVQIPNRIIIRLTFRASVVISVLFVFSLFSKKDTHRNQRGQKIDNFHQPTEKPIQWTERVHFIYNFLRFKPGTFDYFGAKKRSLKPW